MTVAASGGRRFHAWLAWALCASAIALLVASYALRWWYYAPAADAELEIGQAVFGVLFVVSFSVTGALISSRRPRNAVGWIFCAIGVLVVVAALTGDYAEYAFAGGPGTMPLAVSAAWVQNWIWPLVLCPAGLVVLLFPEGRPPSRRWRPVLWVFSAALAGWVVTQALVPGPLLNAGYPGVENPFGVAPLGAVLRPVGAVSGVLLIAAFVASVASVVFRFRASRGIERRQIKWVAYAGVVVVFAAVVPLSVEAVAPKSEALTEASNLSLSLSLIGIPVAAGIAILRHGLYDVDLLINRTLVYGALSVVLALVYLASVVSLQYGFRALTGGGSQLAVVASTLGIAALFGPIRRRVQGFIDRRFYRSKYDARRTLEAFSETLRDETDLGELNRELVGVVRRTIQPEHASLWLRGWPAARRRVETEGGRDAG